MPDPDTGTLTIMTDEGDVIDGLTIASMSINVDKHAQITGDIRLVGTIKFKDSLLQLT